MANSKSNDGRDGSGPNIDETDVDAAIRPDKTDTDVKARLANLPPPGAMRWVIRRKAAVLSAIDAGDLTIVDACERYNLSVEEIDSWRKLIDAHGVRGLRSTRLQQYRKPSDE
ncbi:MAG: DUF1153 domain-containing protein [Alphaproteobacteria bacterium]|nr:DUF1153 domain-containing protein [Alphaproteobacteria bacterium]